MDQGIVVEYNRAKGFGFIRCASFKNDVFVHASAIEGGGSLSTGQRVSFETSASERGPRAAHVIPGRRGISPDSLAWQALLVVLVGGTVGLHQAGLLWATAWLIAMNIVTATAYAWDKHQAGRERRRIPEVALLGLALAGGSPAAGLTMAILHHKIRKPKFMVPFGIIVFVQIAAIFYLNR